MSSSVAIPQEEERRSEEDQHIQQQTKSTNLTAPVPNWQVPRPKSLPTSSQPLPQIQVSKAHAHTHSKSYSEIPPSPQFSGPTNSRSLSTESSWQPEPPRSLWERPRFLHEDWGAERERGVRLEGEEGRSEEEIDREVRRRSIRVDSYDDRPRKDEGCCGCVVM